MEEQLSSEKSVNNLSLKNFFELITKNIVLLLIVTLICSAAGLIFGRFVIKTTYSSTATIAIKIDSLSSDSENVQSEYNNFQYATKLTKACSLFMSSDNVANDAASELKTKGINISSYDIIDNLSFTIVENSLFFNIKFASTNQNAQIILEQIIESAIKVSADTQQDGTKTYGILANRFYESSSSRGIQNNSSSKTVKYFLIAFLIGLILSILIILIKYLFDDTYRSKEQFEKETGVSVLAYIVDLETSGQKSKK